MKRKLKILLLFVLSISISSIFLIKLTFSQGTNKANDTQSLLKNKSSVSEEYKKTMASTHRDSKKVKKPEKKRSFFYDRFHKIKQGGPLMIFIVFLGLAAFIIIIERIIYYTINEMWTPKELEKKLTHIAETSETSYKEDLEDELKAAFQIYANNMEKGLSLLSGIGNIAPIAGFLGTVIGMISAFASIAAATTVNAKIVAGGIQTALMTTAGGLMVAAPTLVFFYLFSHIIQNNYTKSDEVIEHMCKENPRLSSKMETEVSIYDNEPVVNKELVFVNS